MITFGDDDFASSDEANYDSDRIESDIEAELYSVVHHEVDNSTLISDSSCSSSPTKNINCAKNSLQNTKFNDSLSNFFGNKKSDISNSVNKDSCHYYDADDNLNNFDMKNVTLNCKLYTNLEHSKTNKNELSEVSAKRKSEITENVPSNTKKQKKSNTKINNFQKIVSYDDDVDQVSSDNESDVICIGTGNELNNLETNLSKNVINISSDSYQSDSDSDTWCYSFSENSAFNHNQKKIKEPWFINDDDKYHSRRNSGRYHESKILKCHYCYQSGHLAKDCRQFKAPKCFLCGDRHRPADCKNRICSKCYRFGHDGRHCRGKLVHCLHCRMPGHQEDMCPDIWRRYNLTTTKKFIKPKNYSYIAPVYCYNCGRPGHFGGVCMQGKFSTLRFSTFPTWPCVINSKGTRKDTRQQFIKETEKSANPIIDENRFLPKPDTFIDRFLKDKAQTIKENKMRKRRERRWKRLTKGNKADNDKSNKEKSDLSQNSVEAQKNLFNLSQGSRASETPSKKIETDPMETQNFPRTPKKNLNFLQGSKVSETLSKRTETAPTEIPNFPRTPKKNWNSSQESEASETQNQSGKKTLNSKERRARNQRKKMRRKAAKLNRLLEQETNPEVVKNIRKLNQEKNCRPLIIKL